MNRSTIGTLPDYAVVAPKDLVATVKIIPFSVPGNVLAVAEALVRQAGSPLALHPFHHLKVGLVITELPGLKDSVTEKTIAATEQRVTQLTGSLLPPLHSPHEEAPIGKALESLISQGADLLLVVGASAVVDRRDVGPAGIVKAGGEILHFGMPVDPGNLICLGRIGTTPALVLPGCARSPKLNGIDFVLTRLFAGLPVGPTEVMKMGVGGLLKEIDTRPMPREKAPATPRTGRRPAQRADNRRHRAGRRAVATHGAAQQAAGRRPHRQADDRPRGGQRAVIQCPSGAGGDRASVGAGAARAGRQAGPLRPCA